MNKEGWKKLASICQAISYAFGAVVIADWAAAQQALQIWKAWLFGASAFSNAIISVYFANKIED